MTSALKGEEFMAVPILQYLAQNMEKWRLLGLTVTYRLEVQNLSF